MIDGALLWADGEWMKLLVPLVMFSIYALNRLFGGESPAARQAKARQQARANPPAPPADKQRVEDEVGAFCAARRSSAARSGKRRTPPPQPPVVQRRPGAPSPPPAAAETAQAPAHAHPHALRPAQPACIVGAHCRGKRSRASRSGHAVAPVASFQPHGRHAGRNSREHGRGERARSRARRGCRRIAARPAEHSRGHHRQRNLAPPDRALVSAR